MAAPTAAPTGGGAPPGVRPTGQPVAQAGPAARADPGVATSDGTRPAAARPLTTQAAALTCDRCGADNAQTRRLCRRCGHWLVVPAALPPVARTSLRDARPWWLGGDRKEYTGELSRTTVLYRVGAALAAVLLVVGLLTVTGQHPVRRVSDLVGHLRGTGRVTGVTATSGEQQGEPRFAVDGVRARGWSPLWPTAGGPAVDPGTVCDAAPAGGLALTLALPRPTDVREIGIEAGLAAEDPQQAQRWRPQVLRLQWSGGACQAVELAEGPGLQRFGVDQARPVTGVTITILSVHPSDLAGAGPVDLGEVTIWQR